MIPPMAENEAGSPQLAYAAARGYRASGRIGAREALWSLALGLAAALVSGLAVLAWALSPAPMLVFITSLVQGAIAGGVLTLGFAQAKLRNARFAVVIGVLAGLLSILVFQYGRYLQSAFQFRRELVRWQQAGGGAPPGALSWRQALKMYDMVLRFETGRAGFVGYMLWQAESGMHVGSTFTRGGGYWVYFIMEGGAVVVLAALIGRSRVTARPFCEGCGAWFKEPQNAAVVPADLGGLLAAAIEAEEVEAVLAVHQEAAGRELESACAVAQVHACPGCGEHFADVVLRTFPASGDIELLKLRRISPEMLAALRAEVAEMVEGAEHEDADPDGAGAET